MFLFVLYFTIRLDKATKSSASKVQPDNAARYDQLIATLEKDPNVKTDPLKKKALEALQEAKRTNKPLTLEELTKVGQFFM